MKPPIRMFRQAIILFKIRYRKDVFDTEYKFFSPFPSIFSRRGISRPQPISLYLLLGLLFIGYLLHLLRKYIIHERRLKRLLDKEKLRKQSGVNGVGDDVLDRFTLIYNSCDELRAENISYEQRLEKVALIRETVMTALLNPDLLQREELKHFFPDKFIVSARMTIQGSVTTSIAHTGRAGDRPFSRPVGDTGGLYVSCL